jgi:glycosyltransferase involved in cell wall biosynthesis
MIKSPQMSVVLPCYNRGPLLARAVESVLAQTFQPSEIIVVDDGSTDNSKSICDGFGSRLTYVFQKNAGASVARNTGVERASHAWVAFLDSDDYWTPKHLEKMAAAIVETDGAANFYFCDMQMGEAPKAESLWQMIGFAPPKPVQFVADGTNWAFLKRQPMMLQCAVFRKEVWLACGGLEPRFRLIHDTDIFFQLSIGAKVCAVSGVGCVQTSDDTSDVRLTTAIHGGTIAYWEECAGMWAKILRHRPVLSEPYLEMARFNLAVSHWRLLRLNSANGRRGRGLAHLPKIFLAKPGFFFSLLRHRRSDVALPAVTPEYEINADARNLCRRVWCGMFERKERWGLSGRGWLILLIAIAVLGRVWMLNVHAFLAPTRRVDTKILVVEGWVHDYVLRAAMTEFQNGHYEKIYTTGGPIIGSDGAINDFNTSASVGAELLVKFGMRPDQVQMVPSHVSGRDRTYNSALALKSWFAEHHQPLDCINLLTEDAHARRSHLLFAEAIGADVDVGIIAIPDPDYQPNRWWHYSEGVREILGESISYLYARFLFYPEPPPK